MSATDTMRAIQPRITPELINHYRCSIQPLVNRLVEIESMRQLCIIYHKDGSTEIGLSELAPGFEALIIQYKDMIEQTRKSIFGDAA